jgi:TnpA family transposase
MSVSAFESVAPRDPRRPEQEISMLALHLIQNCMVYINTLMIQKLLAQPHWQGKLTPRDYAALTPLI